MKTSGFRTTIDQSLRKVYIVFKKILSLDDPVEQNYLNYPLEEANHKVSKQVSRSNQ